MNEPLQAPLKIAVGIATAGRRDVLADAIAFLARQTRRADALIICPAKPEDIDEARLVEYGAPVTIVSGPVGLPKQRNVLLDSTDADIMIFFDDDFLPAEGFLAEAELTFMNEPSLAILTGWVIADGANGPGISFGDGVKILANYVFDGHVLRTPTYGGYGCNMAVDLRIAREHNIRFDESLPLYGWWEDIDFSRRMAPYGEIIRLNTLRGVHLGSKNGRTSGKRLGYSQIANIVHMQRKGSISAAMAFSQISKNVIANHVKMFNPEPWVDRRGRVIGNWKALGDICLSRVHPERIFDI